MFKKNIKQEEIDLDICFFIQDCVVYIRELSNPMGVSILKSAFLNDHIRDTPLNIDGPKTVIILEKSNGDCLMYTNIKAKIRKIRILQEQALEILFALSDMFTGIISETLIEKGILYQNEEEIFIAHHRIHRKNELS